MTGTPKRLLVIAVALATAGCAAATSTGNGHGTGPGGTSVATSTESPVQLANQLITKANVPAGATRVTRPPTHLLASPPDGGSSAHRIIRMRWWRIDQSLQSTYAWVAHHQPSASLIAEGSSSSGGPAINDVERSADFRPRTLPTTVNSAELSVAVAPLGPDSSVIGAFVTVVPQPPRSKVEDVPLTVDAVTVITRRTSGGTGEGAVLGRRTITGAAAARMVRDFDALTVQPPGEEFSCPMSFITQTAIFRSGIHTWTAVSGFCVGVGVTLDGHRLPTLDASAAFSRDLRAAYGHRFPSSVVPQPMMPRAAQPTTVRTSTTTSNLP